MFCMSVTKIHDSLFLFIHSERPFQGIFPRIVCEAPMSSSGSEVATVRMEPLGREAKGWKKS